VKRRELIRHFGSDVFSSTKGQNIASTSISPIHAALQRFQDILRSPISSHARFAANWVSQIRSRRRSHLISVSRIPERGGSPIIFLIG
jgi:hypothetical protein